MTSIDMDKIVYCSIFSGVRSLPDKAINISFGGATIDGTAGSLDYRTGTGTVNLGRNFSIADIEVSIPELSFGPDILNYVEERYYTDSSESIDPTGAKWVLQLYGEFIGNSIYQFTYVLFPLDSSDPSITVPAFNISVRIMQSIPPFSED